MCEKAIQKLNYQTNSHGLTSFDPVNVQFPIDT
jgi:hypothetical protein